MSKARDLANAGTALGAVTATELGYVDGVTSAIQTQIDSKIGSASAINPTIVDAKGDIIAATAADTVARLPVGTNGQVLTADSTAATGLAYTTLSSGGMTLIEEKVISASTGFSFSSIPQTYKQLILVWGAMNHDGNSSPFSVRLNNNTGSVYAVKGTESNNASANQTNILTTSIRSTNTYPFGESVQGDGVYEGAINGYATIDNYTSTSKYKQINMFYSYTNAFSEQKSGHLLCLYLSTSAITTIDIVRLSGARTISSFANTSVRLYGLA